METERLRAKFRPSTVRTLLVGESPPAGGTFFYAGDSKLFRHTCEAFGHPLASPQDRSAFLSSFRSSGFYLVDLCAVPVNGLSPRDRRAERSRGVERLADVIGELQPAAVVAVMKGIRREVSDAVRLAGLGDLPVYALPFPAFGHQRGYVDGLRELLGELNPAG